MWATALLFALPFYYSQTLPILPGRATNLIDVGVLGGLVIAIGVGLSPNVSRFSHHSPPRCWPTLAWMRCSQGGRWSATSAAPYGDVALREWRTVFLAASLFALLLYACRSDPAAPRLLLVAWIAGGVAIALIGLSQFATDAMLIEAEGVHRVRSLYGSPDTLPSTLSAPSCPPWHCFCFCPTACAAGWHSPPPPFKAAALLHCHCRTSILRADKAGAGGPRRSAPALHAARPTDRFHRGSST